MRSGLACAVALWVLSAAPAGAQLRDVGLVSLASGEVRFAPVNGASAPAKSFMRVREGDRFTLAAGAQLRVVYFEGARQERWTGPSSFRAARAHGEAITGAVATVAQLPAGAPQSIARIPELVQKAKLAADLPRGAGRGAGSEDRPGAMLAEARATYQQMKQALPPDDIAPELYYTAALEEYGKYDEMRVVIEEMQRKQPANDDVKALAEWVVKKTGG